ncbi:MAG: putative porin [Deltaproteobacteria bacterium]
MSRRVFVLGVGLLAWIFGARMACASEVDVLLRKLVEKGILTAPEAQQVREETAEEAAKAEPQKQEAAASGLPDWVKNIKMKGDFRLRYQYNHADDTLNDRHRARIRLRLGLEGKVNDKLAAGVGLATGLSDGSADAARSTNATLANGFSKKDIALDYAYVTYAPKDWIEFVGGKFHNPLWEPTDLVWDGDINPEGGAISFKTALTDNCDVFLNTGVFILDEDNAPGQNDDPMMYVVQPGFNYKATDKVSVKGAFSVNDSANVKGNTLNGTGATNSTAGGGLRYDFLVLEPALQVDVKKPFGFLDIGRLSDIESLAVFTQYVNNTIPDDNNTGFAAGFKLGSAKIAKFGDWQFKYIYAMLERDAVLDVLPDSDRYSGKTGIRSHEGVFEFGLGKNTVLGLDIYRSWSLIGGKNPETVVQMDWNVKF